MVSLAAPSRAPQASDYVDALKRWTRHAQLRHDFDEVLDVFAVLRSPEFREAFAAKYIDLYRVGPDHQPRIRDEIMNDGADTYEFHVSTAAHDYATNDFTSARTIWRITLVDDQQHEVTPSSLTSIRERPAHDHAFYPHTGMFSRTWLIRFPRTRVDGTPLVGPATRSLILRFASPQGSIDLLWRLQDG